MERPYLLHNSASVLVERQSDNLALHALRQELLLDLVTMVKKLLYNIVAKYVLSKSHGVGFQLVKDAIFLITVCGCKLLLDEA